MEDGEIPRSESWASIADQALELAEEHIPSPRSLTVDAWEDGTVRVHVWHYDGEIKESIYYHTNRSDGVIEYALVDDAVEEIKERRAIADPDVINER